MGKKGSGGNSADPKTTALTHLGICIGSKNLKTLRREEVDSAFCNQFLASIYMCVRSCAFGFNFTATYVNFAQNNKTVQILN